MSSVLGSASCYKSDAAPAGGGVAPAGQLAASGSCAAGMLGSKEPASLSARVLALFKKLGVLEVRRSATHSVLEFIAAIASVGSTYPLPPGDWPSTPSVQGKLRRGPERCGQVGPRAPARLKVSQGWWTLRLHRCDRIAPESRTRQLLQGVDRRRELPPPPPPPPPPPTAPRARACCRWPSSG